jgi:hypothetical protein
VQRGSLNCVASDILGKPGRDMLDALVAGETNADVLAEPARKQMRKQIPRPARSASKGTLIHTTGYGSARSCVTPASAAAARLVQTARLGPDNAHPGRARSARRTRHKR